MNASPDVSRTISLIGVTSELPEVETVMAASPDTPVILQYRVVLPMDFYHTTKNHILEIEVISCEKEETTTGTLTLKVVAKAYFLRIKYDSDRNDAVKTVRLRRYVLTLIIVPDSAWIGSGVIGDYVQV